MLPYAKYGGWPKSMIFMEFLKKVPHLHCLLKVVILVETRNIYDKKEIDKVSSTKILTK